MLLVVRRRYRTGSSKCSKAFWAPLMVLTTSPEVAWIYSQGHHVSRDRGLPILPSHSVSSHKPIDSGRLSVYMPPDEEAPDGRIFLCFCLFVFALSCVNFDFRKLPDRCNHCSCPIYKEAVSFPLPSPLPSRLVPHPLLSSQSWGQERHTFSANLLCCLF